MSKKNEYRFNLRFDETDEDHRKVCQFLNDYCGSRKKARYIVKAVLAYWKLENKSIELTSIIPRIDIKTTSYLCFAKGTVSSFGGRRGK